LAGAQRGLFRTKLKPIRILWSPGDRQIHVRAVRLRRDVDYSDLGLETNSLPADADIAELAGLPVSEPETDERDLEIQEDAPGYRDDGTIGWQEFIYGGYRFRPELTFSQRQVFDALVNTLSESDHHRVAGIQSAPGTGKSVCATVIGARLHLEQGWWVGLVAPDELLLDLRKFSVVQEVEHLSERPEGFVLSTLRSLWTLLLPDLKLATPAEELAALKRVAETVRRSGKRVDPEELDASDVLLFQGFVLDQGSDRDVVLNQSQDRLKTLKLLNRLDPTSPGRTTFDGHLDGALSRIEAARRVSAAPPPPPSASHALLMVDEVQDLFLAEVQALDAVRRHWEASGVRTYLLLLGDLNQRIRQTGFYWDRLNQLGVLKRRPEEFRQNFRNSSNILAFANRFHALAEDLARGTGLRLPPPSADPEHAFFGGPQVRFLVLPEEHRPEAFFQPFSEHRHTRLEGDTLPALFLELSDEAKVLTSNYEDLRSRLPDAIRSRLLLLGINNAKGREFEACIAYRLFDGQGPFRLDELYNWYTLITRVRTRLLVVLTPADLARVGAETFRNCDQVSMHEATDWILSASSEVRYDDLMGEDLMGRLLLGCAAGTPYRDTYRALKVAGMDPPDFEREAIEHLRQLAPAALERVVALSRHHAEEDSEGFELLILALRAARRTREAWGLLEREHADLDPGIRLRLMATLDADLKAQGRPLEAALHHARLGAGWPEGYPFPGLPTFPGFLETALAKAFASNLPLETP